VFPDDLVQHRKLPAAKLRSALEDMHTFFRNMPSHIRKDEEPARTKIVAWISELASESESSQSGFVVQLAAMVGEWLTNYLQWVYRPFVFDISEC
jgi:origin recognition complex subunit 3